MSQKNEIYQRLLTNAAEIWGMKNKEIENLDPALQLILGSCAKEFEKIRNELNNSEARIISRLTDFLLPDLYSGSRPAHAVLQAVPTDSMSHVDRFDRFYEERMFRIRRESREERKVRFVFSPVGKFDAINGSVSVQVGSDVLKSENDSGDYDEITRAFPSIGKNELWLGISMPDVDLPYEGMTLYFDWFNHVDKDKMFRLLEFVEVFDIAGNLVPVSHGINRMDIQDHSPFDLLESRSTLLENEVYDYYNPRYIRLQFNETYKLEKGLPKILEDSVPVEGAEELVWMKVNFPSQFNHEQVRDTTALLNCFPMINRDLEKQVFRLNNDFNIRTLDTTSGFLEVESIYSEEGAAYVENPSIKTDQGQKGTFTIRFAGVGRFDRREAHDLVSHTLDQVKDESLAFSAVNLDAFTTELRKINESLIKVQQQAKNLDGDTSKPYAVLYPHKVGEKVFLNYWVTRGAEANGMKPGSALSAVEANRFMNGEAVIRSESVGGTDEKSNLNKIGQLRRAILSRGRMVTRKDLEYRCKELFGDYIESITVTKGVDIADDPGHGLIRTIDVVVKRRRGAIDENTWEELCHQVSFSVKNESGFSIPVRIIDQSLKAKI